MMINLIHLILIIPIIGAIVHEQFAGLMFGDRPRDQCYQTLEGDGEAISIGPTALDSAVKPPLIAILYEGTVFPDCLACRFCQPGQPFAFLALVVQFSQPE